MHRRRFVQSALIVAVGAHARPAAAATTAGVIPAVDTHTHFYDPTRPQGVPWPRPADTLLYAPFLPAAFRTATAGLDVVGTVVIEASPWVEDNQWLLDLAARTPEILAVVGNLKLGQAEFTGQLAQFAADPLFRGLRIGAGTVQEYAAPAVAADLTRLADAGLSLDVLGRSPMLEALERLARRWPTLRIVIDHLPFAEWQGKVDTMRTALRALAACANVYAKLSGVVQRDGNRIVDDAAFYRPQLDALVDLFGPERIVHGTNWPVSERTAPYAVVHRVMHDYFVAQQRRVAENYFWRNSARAYRWVRRGAAVRLAG